MHKKSGELVATRTTRCGLCQKAFKVSMDAVQLVRELLGDALRLILDRRCPVVREHGPPVLDLLHEVVAGVGQRITILVRQVVTIRVFLFLDLRVRVGQRSADALDRLLDLVTALKT